MFAVRISHLLLERLTYANIQRMCSLQLLAAQNKNKTKQNTSKSVLWALQIAFIEYQRTHHSFRRLEIPTSISAPYLRSRTMIQLILTSTAAWRAVSPRAFLRSTSIPKLLEAVLSLHSCFHGIEQRCPSKAASHIIGSPVIDPKT